MLVAKFKPLALLSEGCSRVIKLTRAASGQELRVSRGSVRSQLVHVLLRPLLVYTLTSTVASHSLRRAPCVLTLTLTCGPCQISMHRQEPIQIDSGDSEKPELSSLTFNPPSYTLPTRFHAYFLASWG